MVQRRYQKVLAQGGPFPDLMVIDGGAGQLEAAYAALESLGLANLAITSQYRTDYGMLFAGLVLVALSERDAAVADAKLRAGQAQPEMTGRRVCR